MKALFGLTVLVAIIAGTAGWVMNIFTFVGMLGGDVVTPMLIGRGIGIVVAPLGMVLGWV